MKKLFWGIISISILIGNLFTNSLTSLAEEILAEEISDEKISDEIMGEISLHGEFLDGDILKISVAAKDMQAPTLGIAFHLNYEEQKISFLRYDPGDFLERGGDPFYLVTNGGTNETENGTLVFGSTLRRNDSFPVGEGKISDFYFQIMEDSVFDFKFKNGVVSTLETVRQDIDNILWEDLLLDKNKVALSSSENISDQTQTSNLGIYFSPKIIAIILSFLAFISVILGFGYLKRRQGFFRRSVNFK